MRKNLLLLVVLLAPALARASGYEVIGVNPRELAFAGAGAAIQRDAAAVFYNPAALSKIEGLSLSLAGSLLSNTTEWSAPPGSSVAGEPDVTSEFEPSTPVALFAAYGTKLFGRGLGFGVGMTNPGGANVFWDENWVGRSRIISVSRRIYAFNLNAGYELIPQVRLGGGLLYYYGTQELRQGVGQIPGATAELGATGGGFSYHLAAEVTPFRAIPLVLGVDYKHKNQLEFDGDADFDVPPAFESPATQDQSVETDLVFPNQLNVGASYRPVPRLLLSAVWSFARFVEYEADVFRGETITISVPRNYRNGYILRGGAEYEATERLTVRGGIMRDFSGLRTDTYSPTLPDGNTWGFALGGGWKFSPNLSVGATVFYAMRDEVTSTNNASAENPGGTFPGTYETDIWIASLGITWRTSLLR